MSQFKKESSKKTVQKKDHTQTNTLCSHECSDIQGTYSTISTNFGLQHIALQPAPQFPFGLYRDYLHPHHYYKHCIIILYMDSTRNVTKQKKVEVIEVEDDIDNEEVSDLPSIDFLLRCLDLHVAKDPTVREIIAGHFFVVPQGLEAFVEIYNDDELSDSEIASSMELIPRTKPFYNKSLRKLSAIQIANMMSVEDIRKIWKQWCCNIDEAALEAAMESLRDVCAMGFRAIDVEESLNKAHDRFLCLYNDLFTVNLSITTRYNIATSMDLSVYYFEEFKRKSSKKNSLF
ncbi:hypothetical protein RhiirA5_479729, partial [Rhizophagus irregularis]